MVAMGCGSSSLFGYSAAVAEIREGAAGVAVQEILIADADSRDLAATAVAGSSSCFYSAAEAVDSAVTAAVAANRQYIDPIRKYIPL